MFGNDIIKSSYKLTARYTYLAQSGFDTLKKKILTHNCTFTNKLIEIKFI